MNLKPLTFYNLVATGTLTAFGLYNSHSSPETLTALSLAPIALFFGLTTFSRQHPTASPSPAVVPHPRPTLKETAAPRQKVDISDIDKRAFLKLVGATGLSFFLYSIFNRGVRVPSFGDSSELGTTSLVDVAGNKIDPPEKHPTDGYTISEIDDDTIAFYGFTNKTSAWYIMRKDSDVGSIRYTKGDGGFGNSWINRKQLKYDYYNNVF